MATFNSSDLQPSDESTACNKKSDEKDILPHMIHELEEELERELEMKAEKNNLTARNVKNMIKAVITNEDVIKMVDYSLKRSEEKPVYEPKLTRAKTKVLTGIEQNAIWNIPVGPKKSDIEVLINEELHEDSSDEEYLPQDEWSDEESKASESILEEEFSEETPSKRIRRSKVRQKLDENIGQRTRSKLSLHETPLEVIEQEFIPPDITTDMYNTDCDNVDWLNFLKEFTQPLDSSQVENNDDENDPEYNVMVDEELEATDVEELRVDRAVKVTKKELNDLMSELFEYTDMLSSDDEEEGEKNQDLKSKCDLSYFDNSLELTSPKKDISLNNNVILSDDQPADVKTDVAISIAFSSYQLALLKQQLQQHVQLLLQSFLLSYRHPYLEEDYAFNCKKHLLELYNLKFNRINIINLQNSLQLIEEWEQNLMRPEELTTFLNFLNGEMKKYEIAKKKRADYLPELPGCMVKVCMNSTAFIYPLFLPQIGFREFIINKGNHFFHPERQLLALGLEQFSLYLDSDLNISEDLLEVVDNIQHLLIPVKTRRQILLHINYLKSSKTPNPVKEFFRTGKAPIVRHFVLSFLERDVKKICDQSFDLLPSSWIKYLTKQ